MGASSQTIEAFATAFRRRFVLIVTAAGGFAIGVAFIMALALPTIRYMAPIFAVGLLVVVGTHAMARSGRVELAARIFLGVAVVAVTAGSAAKALPTAISGALVGFILVGCMASFLLQTWELVLFAMASAAGTLVVTLRVLRAGVLEPDLAWSACSSGLVMFCLALTTLRVFSRHHQDGLDLLQTRMADIAKVMASARRIADGDLATDVEGDSEVSETVRRMLLSLRRVVTEIRRNVSELTSAAAQISAMAEAQQAGAVAQASAADEVNATLGTLREASTRVTHSAEEVHDAITITQQSGERAEQRMAELADQAQRIDEIAVMIRDVASKSEVLALNAALEGVRAGAQGRGFSLVAAEMQTLAERVTDAVKDVQKLTRDIDQATRATVEATHEGAARAAGATDASRRIRDDARRQLDSAAQASGAMNDVARAANESSVASRQTLEAAAALRELAHSLSELVTGFELDLDADVRRASKPEDSQP